MNKTSEVRLTQGEGVLGENKLITDLASAYKAIEHSFFEILPNIASALLVLLAGLLIGILLRWLTILLTRSVVRLIPNQFIERETLLKNAKPLAMGMGNIIFLIILFLTGVSALNKLGLIVISEWLEKIALHLPNVVGAFLILAIGWKLKTFIGDFLFKSFNQARVSRARDLSNAVGWFVFMVGLIVAIQQLGVDMELVIVMTSVLGGVVAGGVALTFSLGARETVSNILSCHQIKKHVKSGQKLKHNNVEGTVVSVGPTYVLISTDQGQMIVPGASFGVQTTMIWDGEN